LHHPPKARKHWALHVANVCCENKRRKYGYARVSTDDQMERAALKKAGVPRQNIFTDNGLSGGTTNRPALRRCLKKLEPGDMLIVWKLDRLSRNVRDLVIMADDLKERGV
jgi:serine recombinase